MRRLGVAGWVAVGRASGPAAGPGLPIRPDLGGVDVGVGRVDLEPLLRGVGTRLAVDPGSPPVRLGHRVEELPRRRPRRLEGLEGRLHGAALIAEGAGVFLLVVALDERLVLDQQAAEADARDRLAVGEVVHYLASAPFAGSGAPVALL